MTTRTCFICRKHQGPHFKRLSRRDVTVNANADCQWTRRVVVDVMEVKE